MGGASLTEGSPTSRQVSASLTTGTHVWDALVARRHTSGGTTNPRSGRGNLNHVLQSSTMRRRAFGQSGAKEPD